MKNQESGPGRGGLASLIVFALAGTVVLLAVAVVSVFYLGLITIFVWIFAFTLFHYLTWGWWLGKMIHADAETDDSA